MTDEEIIAVVTAHKEGKTIEVTSKGELNWEVTSNPCWDFVCFDYRIKPEPHYRPFESAEDFMSVAQEKGYALKVKDSCNYVAIAEYTDYGVWAGAQVSEAVPFDMAFKKYTFVDGTPFGKLEE